MFNLDGSNTCWLIYADWLYDNDQPDKADLIRQQIEYKPKPKWNYQYKLSSVGFGSVGGGGMVLFGSVGFGSVGFGSVVGGGVGSVGVGSVGFGSVVGGL